MKLIELMVGAFVLFLLLFTEDALGTVTAPDEATAKIKAIEFFGIEPALQFRVVAVKLAAKPAKATAR